MRFPDVSRLGSVTVPEAGDFIILLVREDLTPGEAAGVLRGKIARAKHPLDAYDAGIEDVIDAVRAALASEDRSRVEGLNRAQVVVEMERQRRGLTRSHQTMTAHDHDRCVRNADNAVEQAIDDLDAALALTPRSPG